MQFYKRGKIPKYAKKKIEVLLYPYLNNKITLYTDLEK